MNAKQLQAIALGLALLLLLWGASALLSRGSDRTTGSLALPRMTPTSVDTVMITHGADTVMLAKQPSGGWTVNGLLASQTAVGDLFQAVADTTPAELAAQSASSFARMGVDSASGRLLRFVGGATTLARVIVGGYGPGFDASYVRTAGSTKVFLWRGKLPKVAQRAQDDWRDHTIATVPPESIAAVEIQRGAKRYVLRKQAATWTLTGGSAGDSAAVAQLLERFRTVTASGFASKKQADSASFARPARRVTLMGPAGKDLLALAFDSTAGGFWVRRPGGGTVYRLDSWQADQLTPAEQALIKK